MKVAVVGATGLVGRKMLQVLEQRNFPVTELIPVASVNSKGKQVEFRSEKHEVITINQALEKKPDIALFSAGSGVSKQFAPEFAKNGTYVIDNSSAWRMDKNVKLIVPEVNGDILDKDDYLIANPNCSTIQMVMVLAPLHKQYKIKRIVVSTYQSVTGAGYKALEQLIHERSGFEAEMKFPHRIDLNTLPHCDVFLDNAYTKEEMKLVNETHKILNDYSIAVSATAVRVPVTGGHSESVNVEFWESYDLEQVKQILSETPGVVLVDEPGKNLYPMPLDAKDKDEVFVGRLRRDLFVENALNMWIVADNLRKGAATNAVQIAEKLIEKNFISSD